MKVLFISHTAMGGPFVVGSHQLARAMVRLGHNVLHLSPPITPAHLMLFGNSFERTRFKRWLRGGDEIEGVIDVVPASFLSWGVARLLGSGFHKFGNGVKREALKSLDHYKFLCPDIVFIDEPRLGYLLDFLNCQRIVYRPTDIYAKLRNDLSIIEAEKAVISRSNAFIATSQPVADHLYELGVTSPLVMENGVEIEHFMDGLDFDIELELPPKPRAIYAGALDERFGADILDVAAKHNPNVSFLLLGPANGSVQAKLKKHCNVHFIGPVSYNHLPSYLRRSQVGLLPLSAHSSNEGRSPMKLFEYAATGLSVISTATAEISRRKLPFVHLARTDEEFSRLIADAVQTPLPEQYCIESAKLHSWTNKAQVALDYAQHQGSKPC